MNRQILGLRVAGAMFGLLALLQLTRLMLRPEIVVAGHLMPLWPSMLALFILGGLSLWIFRLARVAPMIK